MTNNRPSNIERVMGLFEYAGYTFVDDWGSLYFKKAFGNKLLIVAVTAPHEGNGYKWLVRADDIEYHDRWSNADYEQYYDTIDDLVDRVLEDLNNEARV